MILLFPKKLIPFKIRLKETLRNENKLGATTNSLVAPVRKKRVGFVFSRMFAPFDVAQGHLSDLGFELKRVR